MAARYFLVDTSRIPRDKVPGRKTFPSGSVAGRFTGTLAECITAWEETVRGFYRDYTKCPSIGLLAQKGNVYSYHHGGKGSYTIRIAPELTENPTYEVSPGLFDTPTPAGHTIAEAEVVMRRMGEGPGRLLILTNRENGSRYVYEANSLGYLDSKGTYERFFGGAR
jgi:hypothetical protein